jgi:hypothetical protein
MPSATATAVRDDGVGDEAGDEEIAPRVDALRWGPDHRLIVEIA